MRGPTEIKITMEVDNVPWIINDPGEETIWRVHDTGFEAFLACDSMAEGRILDKYTIEQEKVRYNKMKDISVNPNHFMD